MPSFPETSFSVEHKSDVFRIFFLARAGEVIKFFHWNKLANSMIEVGREDIPVFLNRERVREFRVPVDA